MKCAVKNCTNYSHQGKFIGLLCSPCHTFIAGDGGLYSQAYRNSRSMIDVAIAMEREACAKVCEDIDAEYEGEDVPATWCAAAIRARGST